MDKDISLNPNHLLNTDNFSGLSVETVEALLSASHVKQVPTGDALYRAGDKYQDELYVVYQGKLERHDDSGHIKVVDEGEVLSLSNYLDGSAHRSTAIAQTDVLVLCIPAAQVRQLELGHPLLANLFNALIAQGIKKSSIATHTVTGPLSSLVRSVMKTPITTCDREATLGQAFHIMDDRKIGALGVLNKNNTLFGVLTYAGLAEAFVSRQATPDSQINIAACDVPRTIEPDAPLWRANEILDQFNSKYLFVVENNKPIGLLSQTDITKSLLVENSGLHQQINQADSFSALRTIYENLAEYAQQCHDTNHRASQAIYSLSNAHLAIQSRVIQLTLNDIEKKQGVAPRKYALIIMGSGGRNEMLLNPDQDNGIIINDADHPLSDKEKAWFDLFTDTVNINLDKAGYILCPGDIMARNPMYHKLLSQWKDQISHLVKKPTAKAARWANIVFDFDVFYGETELTLTLRQHLLGELKQHPRLLEYMVEDDAEGRPALGLFNQLVTSEHGENKGSIDIKRNGLRIIADAARVYALSEGIAENNTLKRLNTLVHCGRLSPELVESVRYAYEELLDMLLLHQLGQVRQGNSPNKLIYPDQLSEQAKSVLQVSMRAIKRLQDQLQGEYGRSAF